MFSFRPWRVNITELVSGPPRTRLVGAVALISRGS